MGSAISSARSLPSSHELTIESKEQWESRYNEFKHFSNLIVIDFTAACGGPCIIMVPVINDRAKNFTDVQFFKIDVDQLKDVAQDFKVNAMPTFVLLKKGNEVDRVIGAKKDELKNKIEKHRDSQASA